jgi:hypothetical protein
MTTFIAPDYTPVPSGVYRAQFEGTEERESERGGYVRWGWRIVEGELADRMVFGNTSTNFGPQAKARGWLEAKLDRPIEPGETVDPDELIGNVYTICVENTAPDSKGRVYDNVADVLGPADEGDEGDLGNLGNTAN